MKPLICKVSLTDLPVNLFNEWWDPYMVWNHDSLSLSLLIFKWRKRWTDMHEEIWGSANHLQTVISGRFGKTFILSKKKRGRARQEKPLKFFILRKMVTLSHLMADKCSLPVTRTDKQSVSLSCPGCRTEKCRIPKVTITSISLNQHTEPPAAGTCWAVVPERWARSGEAAASCLPV